MLAMEACSWNSTGAQVSGFEVMGGGFLVNSGLQAKTRTGSSSTSALVLDNERGELVESTVRMERKVVSAERSIAALKNHSEAEKKRRARINAHLDTLRSLVPGTSKNLIGARGDVREIFQVGACISLVFLMDKASLLAEVITHLKELKSQATEASEGLLMPLDIDELRVEQQEGDLHGGPYIITASICCDCKPGVLSDLRQALDAFHLIIMRAEIATLEGRMKNVFVMSSCKEGGGGDTKAHQFLGGSICQALRSILDKFSASQEFSLKSTLSNKRRRVGLFKPSLSSSSGDHWVWMRPLGFFMLGKGDSLCGVVEPSEEFETRGGKLYVGKSCFGGGGLQEEAIKIKGRSSVCDLGGLVSIYGIRFLFPFICLTVKVY
ncbi:hypothetical protein SADUNF_Sadunf19G0095100 [Salix dunnii]|uniref:BHLH domain-containing protein n=1 Tax=Salix dunnii TaxID=1413687 RepID=A0A835J1C5_9ROSI|nr:hypothetical protein SADUNF_Sadunf19G0095100 [Salix dunnii]